MSTPVRALTTTTLAPMDSLVTRSSIGVDLPRCYGGSITRRHFRGLLSVRCALGPYRRWPPEEAFSLDALTHSLPPELLQSTSGRSNSCRVGFEPTEPIALSRVHIKTSLRELSNPMSSEERTFSFTVHMTPLKTLPPCIPSSKLVNKITSIPLTISRMYSPDCLPRSIRISIFCYLISGTGSLTLLKQ